MRRTLAGLALRSMWLLLAAAPGLVWAEQLPVKLYTTADGLAQNNVVRIVRDSHGFLWFCTRDGLSRYDGYAFTNYGMAEGLPHPNVNHLIEARDGSYWVATNGAGVARLNPSSGRRGGGAAMDQVELTARAAAPLFTVYPVGTEPATNRVNVLYQDRAGQIWAGTDGELFRLEQADGREVFRKVELGLPPGHRWVVVLALAEDHEGRLWVGTWDGVFVRTTDGRTVRLSVAPAQGYDYVRALLADAEGRLWMGHLGAGLVVLDAERRRAVDALPPQERHDIRRLGTEAGRWFKTADGLADTYVQALYQSSDGRVWVGTGEGLSEYDGQRFRTHTRAEGVTAAPLLWLTEDIGGNLWAATGRGALKLTRTGFTSFQQAEGLSGAGVRSAFETGAGEFYVVTDDATIHQFDGRRFRGVRLRLPQGLGLEWPQLVRQDRAGEWWAATNAGLFRFPRVSRFEELGRVPPKAVYGKDNQLMGSGILHLYEDSRGDIWVSVGDVKYNIVRWERATETFHTYTEADGAPPYYPPSCFVEDRSGALWIGRYDGGLLRYRAGRFQVFTAADGVPAGQVNQLLLDRAGRLWIATTGGGVGRIDDPTQERPAVVRLTQALGLTSNSVISLAEDEGGRVYFGTGRGLDRLDPSTGRITHYAGADGLVDDKVEVALRDRQDALWFGTPRGLARLVPRGLRPNAPPPVFITGLHVAGDPVPLSELGQAEVTGLELSHTQNRLLIDYAGLGFAFGASLRYQYKLEGVDADWSAPGAERYANYPMLAPGNYRFLVRAVNANGDFSATPAAVSFRVLPPVWQRWWFVALVLVGAALAVFGLYRYRVTQLLAVANMRTRIATDLHDDIGANLTKIAILSEVAKQGSGAGAGSQLSSIARISRESIDSMSDIVWAINPKRDNLRDLVRRMRQHAEEVFTLRGVELRFDAPGAEQKSRLGVDVRRDLFLIFKEAVNNAVRHSGCSRVEIELRPEGAWLGLRVSDDGVGFDAAAGGEGQGLVSMQRRAESLGGVLQVVSGRGRGTVVSLKIPFARPRFMA